MPAPLDGVRVLEVANWLAAPAATALMADLGADVIKVEPPGGDPYRGYVLRATGYDFEFATNYAFELDNRGKRSITVDLERAGGPELVRRLAASCDIFVSNLTPGRAERYGLGFAAIREARGDVVYASFTGYGNDGPDRERTGFDGVAFWARSGVMGLLGEPGAPPPLCRGGQGDHAASLNLLSATLAALRLRDRTGQAQLVEVSLQASGMWTIAADFAAALASRSQPKIRGRAWPAHPLRNTYRCSDGRWLLLNHGSPFPAYWPRFCAIVGRPEWTDDARWSTLATIHEHGPYLVAEIDAILATRPLAAWAVDFDAAGLIWAPVATMPEVIDDPQVRTMGWVTTLEHPAVGSFDTLDTPFRIHGSDTAARGPAPAAGQHTFDVLAALGLRDDEIDVLAVNGVIG